MKTPIQKAYETASAIEDKLNTSTLSCEDMEVFSDALKATGVDHLANLAVRLKEGMNLEQFICFVVPLERELNNRITDSEILVETADLKSRAVENDLIVVLDNIRSPFNMGAIVRTCDALGVKELVTTGYTPGFENEKVKKISMGAWISVRLNKFRDFKEASFYLKSMDYSIVGVETVKGAGVIHEKKLPSKTALVFGNERFGLTKADLQTCDHIVKLPVFGVKNSLNVNAAITACGYEWVRQNGKP